MSKVLYITANPGSEERSFSLSIGRAFLNAYRLNNPADEIVELDVYQMDIPLIDAEVLNAWGALKEGASLDTLSSSAQAKVTTLASLTDQFMAADKYIFVTPMWNLGMPPMMKAYIDSLIIAGKTFQYTEHGPQGLLQGKKGIHINARGGNYSGEGAAYEFGDSHLRAIMGFIGVEMLESVVAEGMAYAPEQADAIKQAAIAFGEEKAKQLALA